MKVVVIADTHGILETLQYQIPDVDFVILLGDIYRTELLKINDFFQCPILGIYGNHDIEHLFKETKIQNIHKKKYTVQNISIQGFQGSVQYKPNQIFGYTQKESIQELKELDFCDILCCHDGPYKYGNNDAHIGLKGITKYVKKKKPHILFFGHHHKNKRFQLKDTDCYNIYGVSIFTIENKKVIEWIY